VLGTRVTICANAGCTLLGCPNNAEMLEVVALKRHPVALREMSERLRSGALAVVVDVCEEHESVLERRGVAPRSARLICDCLEPRCKAAGGDHVREPSVSKPPSAADRGVRASADEERWAAFTHRGRLDRHPGEAIESTSEGRSSLGQKRSKSNKTLVGATAALCDRHPGCLEIASALAADAEPEKQPSAREVIERGRLLRDQARVPQREKDDTRAEEDPFGDRGERRERDAEIEDRVVEREVLACPDRVVPELLRELGDGTEASGVRKTLRELPRSLDPDLDQSPGRRACRQAFS